MPLPEIPAEQYVAPTMEDVAKEAGVSRMTVSRVVNNPETVTPRTLASVKAAIQKLGYVPNLNAGSLASKRSHIIGAVIPTIANPFFSDTIHALSQTLARRGYQLLLGESRYQPNEEASLIDAFLGRRVDGLVLIRTSTPEAMATRLKNASIPVVEAWNMPETTVDMLVGFSHEEAGRAAGQYLGAKGYRRFGYVGSLEPRSSARLKGLQEAARQLNLPPVESVTLPSPNSIADARRCLATILEHWPDMDAVFCSSDMLAAGMLFECQRRGIAVPGQLAIMGFADLPIAAETCPALTTIRVPSREIGIKAAEMLLTRLELKDEVEERLDLGFSIIERDSA